MMRTTETTLGDICRDSGGGIQTGPFGSQLHSSDYQDEGIPVVMPQDIGDGGIVETRVARVPNEEVERLSRYKLRAGDIVYSRRGDVERSALVRPANEGWLCGTGCLRVRTDDLQVIIPEFLAYYLRLPAVRLWISQNAIGATMPNLNSKILGRIPLAIPEIRSQSAIADVLGALDDKIAANEKVIAHADQLALAALEASIGTETTTVGELAQVTMGTSPSGDTFNEDGVGEPFFQGVRDFGIRAPKVRIWTTKPVRTASAGDVLLSVRAPVGRLNRAHENLAIGRGLAAIQALDGDNDLLYYRLRLAEGEWQSFSGDGTLFSSVNRKQIEGIKLRELVASGVREAVSSIEWSLRSMLDESASLAGTRDELLPLLMSGKISVKDAETVVSDAV